MPDDDIDGDSPQQEAWAEIPGHPGYVASTLGNIMGPTGRILKPQMRKRKTNGKVYPHVEIREKRMPVHKLVLTAFVGARPQSMQCRHLDDDPANNRLENICWGTRLDNRTDAIKNGRMRSFTADELKYIRKPGISGRVVAAQLGISKSLVQLIRSKQISLLSG